MYVATTAGIYDVQLSDGTTHKHYGYGWFNWHAKVVLKYVKSRVIAAFGFTNGTYSAYELIPFKGMVAHLLKLNQAMTSFTRELINGSTLHAYIVAVDRYYRRN
jgi:hypothetical protein